MVKFLNQSYFFSLFSRKGGFCHVVLTVLLIFFVAPLSRANEDESPIRRMSNILSELKKNPNNIDALIDASTTYIDLCDYEGARNMALRLESVGQHCSDSVRANFYSYFFRGKISLVSGNADDGLREAEKALIIAQRHDLPLEQALAYNLMGMAFVHLDSDFASGLEYYNNAFVIAKSIDDYKLVVKILNNISEAFLWTNEFSGIKYADEALKISREHEYNYGILISQINIIHFSLFSMKSLEMIPRMISEVEKLQNRVGYVSQGEINLLKGHFYLTVDDNEAAEKIFSESLDDNAPMMSTLLKIKTMIYYSWALIKLEQFEKSINVNENVLSICQSSGNQYFLPYVLSAISYCYEKEGKFEEALQYLKQYHNMVAGSWIVGQSNSLNKTRVENEVRLNESKILRQQTQINERERFIIFLSVIGFVLVVCLVMMVRFYHSKSKLVRTVIEREKESLMREKLLKQSLDQARKELSEIGKPVASSPSLSEDRMYDLMVRFNELMTEKKVYTDTNISIKSVAEALDTNRTYLSNAINGVFNKSFPQVLAEYRVRAAIDMLNNPECDLPLKAIAVEVGFSSSSVFFTTFRNIMGMTPTAYRNSLTK